MSACYRPAADVSIQCSGNQKGNMQNSSYRIAEVFEITARGTVAVFDELIELSTGKSVHVKIIRPDGSVLDAMACIELLLRRTPTVTEKSVLLLQNIPKDAVPIGSMLAFR